MSNQDPITHLHAVTVEPAAVTGRTFEDSVAKNGLDGVQADGTGLRQTELWAHGQSLSRPVVSTERPATTNRPQSSSRLRRTLDESTSPDSREESSKLGNEVQLPATGEVDRLPAAFDVAADTRPLRLAPAARLEESVATPERARPQQRAGEANRVWPAEPSGAFPAWCRPPGSQRRLRAPRHAGKRHRTLTEASVKGQRESGSYLPLSRPQTLGFGVVFTVYLRIYWRTLWDLSVQCG